LLITRWQTEHASIADGLIGGELDGLVAEETCIFAQNAGMCASLASNGVGCDRQEIEAYLGVEIA
jgi:hypothetical protein